jgi:hypothetical protein
MNRSVAAALETVSKDWTTAVNESPLCNAAGMFCIDGNIALVGARVNVKRRRMTLPAESGAGNEDPYPRTESTLTSARHGAVLQGSPAVVPETGRTFTIVALRRHVFGGSGIGGEGAGMVVWSFASRGVLQDTASVAQRETITVNEAVEYIRERVPCQIIGRDICDS